MPSQPVEVHSWAGALADWFAVAGINYEAHIEQPITLHINGCLVPAELWSSTVVSDMDDVAIRPIPRAIPAWVGWAVMAIAAVTTAVLMRPKTPNTRYDTPQGQQLSAAEGTANVARLNAVVPELLGHFIRRPDYLVPPRRYFGSPREQWLEMLLCVGPGEYEIDTSTVKIGNTPLVDVDGAEFAIHPPGDDLSSLSMHEHWYASPEVGGTSAGTAGLDLTATDSGSVNPTATSYTLDGGEIIADVDFPDSWGAGTVMSLLFEQDVTVGIDGGPGDEHNTFTADWREIAPSPGLMITASGALTGSLRVATVAGDTLTLEQQTGTSEYGTPIYTLVSGLPPSVVSLAVGRAGRAYTVTEVSGNVLVVVPTDGAPWEGFAPRTVPASGAVWAVEPNSVYGEIAGPFVACPAAEVTTVFEVDVFFPRGLNYISDDGRVRSRSVGIEISWRDAAGGSWQNLTRTYTAAEMDQIGYTERVVMPNAIRPEVRLRRLGAHSTSTQVNDVVQWYAMRCRLPARTSYPDWTTISVRVRGLGQIAASSEHQISLEATELKSEVVYGGVEAGVEGGGGFS